MRHRQLWSFVGLLGLLVAAPIQADNINLSPIADIRILSLAPNSNEGNGGLLSVYNQPGNVQRTLLQFALGAIPAGQKIDSAILTLYTNFEYGNNNPSNLNMDVHSVTKSWVETEVTWNSASTGNPWATPGGDFDPTIYATSTANPAAFAPVTWDVTQLVQDWYDGSVDNNGLLIKSFPGNGIHFDSMGQSNAGLRPTLAISYSVVPETSSVVLMGLGAAMLIGVARRRRQIARTPQAMDAE